MVHLPALGLWLVTSTLVAANVPFDSYVFNGGRLNNLTIAINVPQNATDDLYFHFQAPADRQWSAFGFGDGMVGALMFVVYGRSDGEGITVSPRLATDHVLPQYTSGVNITTFSGTQVVDGNYFVNARCTGCRKWNGGQIAADSTTQSMIWAVGPPVDSSSTSDDVNYKITRHDPTNVRTFSLSMQKATGEAGVPDVLGVPITNHNGETDADDGPSHFPIAFHAFMLIVAFLVIFPGGYLLLRLFEKVWLHMAVQTTGLVFVITGIVTGIVASEKRKISPNLSHPHQIIGLLVLVLTLIAWGLGLVGHQLFKKRGDKSIVSMVHRGAGPFAILFGLINVGLGFNFAGNTRRVIPFYIVTLIVFTLIGGFVYMIRRRRVRQQAMNTPAAQNFKEAYQPSETSAGNNMGNARAENVPMQTFLPPVTQPQTALLPGYKL